MEKLSEIKPPLRDEKDGFDVIISLVFKGQKKAIRGSKETDRKCCVRDWWKGGDFVGA